jgi:cell division protein FtsB
LPYALSLRASQPQEFTFYLTDMKSNLFSPKNMQRLALTIIGAIAVMIVTAAVSEATYIQQSLRNGNEAMRQCAAQRAEIDNLKKCSADMERKEALFMQETRSQFKYIREELQDNKEMLKALIQKI